MFKIYHVHFHMQYNRPGEAFINQNQPGTGLGNRIDQFRVLFKSEKKSCLASLSIDFLRHLQT